MSRDDRQRKRVESHRNEPDELAEFLKLLGRLIARRHLERTGSQSAKTREAPRPGLRRAAARKNPRKT